MQPAEMATHKLIVLAILSRTPGITLSQLTGLALETLYMDYFDFVTAFDELCRDRLATESVNKGEKVRDASGKLITRIYLTPAGEILYTTLEDRIPMPIRSYLAQACADWQQDKRREQQLSAECDPDGNGFYQVRLRQNDGRRDILELNLTLPDQQVGRAICARWLRQPQTLYLGLLSLLTGEVLPPSGDSGKPAMPHDHDVWIDQEQQAYALDEDDERQTTLFDEPQSR